MHRLTDPMATPERLSQSVVQVGELLGLYRAEVARVLGFRCQNITALFEGQLTLEPGTFAWEQGVLFVRFYQLLFDRMAGEGPRMVHWLRVENRALGNSPFLLMVDEGRIAEVVAYLEASD